MYHIAAICFFIGYVFLKTVGRRSVSLLYLMKAIRTKQQPFFLNYLKKELQYGMVYSPKFGVSFDETYHRSIVLSLPFFEDDKCICKGVLLITFTETLAYYLGTDKFDLVNKYFVLVIEPSSSGYADPEIIGMIQSADDCVVLATEVKDRALINCMFPNIPVATFGASDWVSPVIFTPTSTVKEFDSVYVANMNPVKRIYRYIDAIAKLMTSNPEYVGCLICARFGGDINGVSEYIRCKGVEENIVFIPGLERSELIDVVQKAKVSVLLSLKEGSNRTLFESMFLNVPVVCISENIGVNKEYINSNTGLLVPDAFLEDSLRYFADAGDIWRPRDWALANISPYQTINRLAEILKVKYGETCDYNLQVKVNAPELEYADRDDHLEVNEMLLGSLAVGDEKKFIKNVQGLRPYF